VKRQNRTRVQPAARTSGRQSGRPSEQPAAPVLVRWSQVFPLSAGPEQRIYRQAGADIDPPELAAATASYVQQINRRLPERLRFDRDGSVRGPIEQSQRAAQALFGAAFDTDLDAIIRQVRRV
jgi:hypothetical protein